MMFHMSRGALAPHRLVAPVALLALLAGVASVVMAQPPEGAGQPGPRHASMHRMGPGMGAPVSVPGMLSERELDAVGASAEQKGKLREIRRAAQDDLRRQHDSARELHQQMQQLLAAPQVDAAAAEALRQKLNAQHDLASKRMLQAALDSGAVFTPEQRQKLAERRAQQRERLQRPPPEREGGRPPHS
ncbi:Spy/CpxP family protein refolding chaperone [Aquabacterium sp. OR-4]|uniref:Spy/CpxP family protein refolding chaperone n=1 Tax=Aquabacterium sp. OR-4 TaxID=2978127 RepID=UPI0021B25705|nr:periplasmic heavy metal sensor [Aquabacterium sp. OR-4]MDT7836623.1 periplasmic heavy metal sensor [Aquabacterium sp. OR-4]